MTVEIEKLMKVNNDANNFFADHEFRIFENFFDMCGVVVSARIVDLIDKQVCGF